MLCRTNSDCARSSVDLSRRGIPTELLSRCAGRSIDAVKVGTYQRAKGLEFVWVVIPNHKDVPKPQREEESADAYAGRATLERRHLFVAMTRAREGLWLG